MPFLRQRDGISTLGKLARLLCRALSKFTPYIIEKYPTNAALLAALAAAAAACQALEAEIVKVTVYGD